MENYIEKTVKGNDLTVEEAQNAVEQIFEDATDAQIGSLLTALRTKGETEQEIAGFAKGMKEAAINCQVENRENLLDTCGTGGDDYDTINVSTTSSIVAAAAGATVAKHGNYSVSSSSGSADVLEKLGVEIEAQPDKVEKAIENTGIGFMLAPVFHPAMERVIQPRKELGIRTIFNILGPLTNPAEVKNQIIGVYNEELVDKMAEVLAIMGVEKALVVHGSGLDEIAIHGPTKIAEINGDQKKLYTVKPEDFGLEQKPVEHIAGGTPQENAEDLKNILSGKEKGAKRDIILLNTGATLYAAEVVDSIQQGVEEAKEAVGTGKAEEKLEEMKKHQ
jgi:anthranilate phosphoribosyltransferase